MSPEQIKAEPIDGRTDQYSLAVVAYELFTGKKPFEAETLSSLVFKIAQQPPPPLDNVPPHLASRIGPVLLRALAKDPASRYRTCAEFVDALEGALQAPAPRAARSAVQPAAPPKKPSRPALPAFRVSPRVLAAAAAVCAGLALIAWMAVKLQEPAPRVQLPAGPVDSAVEEAPKPATGDAAPPAEPVAAVAETKAERTQASPPATLVQTPPRATPVQTPPPSVQSAPAKQKPAPQSTASAAAPATPSPAPSAKPETPPQTAPSVAEAKPEPARPAAEPPEPAPAPREPLRTPPRPVQTAPAPYTPEALQKGIEGSVLLSVDIDEQGVPRRARVLRSLEPGLDRKAIESLAGWRFSPATEDGKPVASTANVEVNFSMVGAPRRTPPSLKSLKK
jgi:serine/threonine-protein kinase